MRRVFPLEKCPFEWLKQTLWGINQSALSDLENNSSGLMHSVLLRPSRVKCAHARRTKHASSAAAAAIVVSCGMPTTPLRPLHPLHLLLGPLCARLEINALLIGLTAAASASGVGGKGLSYITY